jgi:hypothetical protein
LGYFPDPARADKATRRHAEDDPTELGAQLIVQPNEEADFVFDDPDCPDGMWFTSGNHEDFEVLDRLSRSSGRHSDFVVDAYCRVRCIKNGQITTLPGDLQVGALWGVDGAGPNARRKLPPLGYIQPRAVNNLLASTFHVLLTHDAPLNGKREGYGSEEIDGLIRIVQPDFAFFGHYESRPGKIERDYGRTQVYHLSGFEMHGQGGTVEPGCVGVLRWDGLSGTFEYLDESWLRTFSRHNWRYR